MKLTTEQEAIIHSQGDIRINAVAGSGKTTTIIAYAKSRTPESRILYLAFNKSVKLEAAKKFSDLGMQNVRVETAHSLAFRNIVSRSSYKVKAQGYKTSEIADLLQLESRGEKHAEYIVANHINKFITYFCNSDKRKVQELNYLDTITDITAKNFVANFYDYILEQTRKLLAKMDKAEIEISHDFYLKKFQLSNPQLPFDYILFDEGQDASAAMLDIFLNQEATKLIVGDTHQQIYGWRFAVNSLERTEFKSFNLSTSFRFSQNIANLAMEILKLKEIIGIKTNAQIVGNGATNLQKSKVMIARTNLGLLLEAINYSTNKPNTKIYFEGNIHSYTYADEGASLYDVLSLYNNRFENIKDKLIGSMKSLTELEDYIDKTEDVQLRIMVEIVREYGNRIPDILRSIKEKHVGDDQKEQAEMIFSTVHRCKGMEYDVVQLAEDFISEDRLKKIMEEKDKEISITKLNEEINLLYVAVTRTKSLLKIPENLLPANFPVSKDIETVRKKADQSTLNIQKDLYSITGRYNRNKTVHIEKTKNHDRSESKAAGTNKRWTDALDQEMIKLYNEGYDIRDLADHFERTRGAVWYRLKKLGLED